MADELELRMDATTLYREETYGDNAGHQPAMP